MPQLYSELLSKLTSLVPENDEVKKLLKDCQVFNIFPQLSNCVKHFDYSLLKYAYWPKSPIFVQTDGGNFSHGWLVSPNVYKANQMIVIYVCKRVGLLMSKAVAHLDVLKMEEAQSMSQMSSDIAITMPQRYRRYQEILMPGSDPERDYYLTSNSLIPLLTYLLLLACPNIIKRKSKGVINVFPAKVPKIIKLLCCTQAFKLKNNHIDYIY